MTEMTLLYIELVVVAIGAASLVIYVARDSERKRAELGDLPALLLLMFFTAVLYCAVVYLRRLDAKMSNASVMDERRPVEQRRR